MILVANNTGEVHQDDNDNINVYQPIVNGLLTFTISLVHNSTDAKITELLVKHFDGTEIKDATWCYRVRSFYVEIEHDQICAANRLAVRATLNSVDNQLQILYEKQWNNLLNLNADFARRGQEEGGNKLRTYRRVKQNYATEQYVKILIQKKYRSAYAKFRCGVAPIKLETGDMV